MRSSVVIVGLGIFLKSKLGDFLVVTNTKKISGNHFMSKNGFSLAYVFKNKKSESEMWNIIDTAAWVILYLLFYPTLCKFRSKPTILF